MTSRCSRRVGNKRPQWRCCNCRPWWKRNHVLVIVDDDDKTLPRTMLHLWRQRRTVRKQKYCRRCWGRQNAILSFSATVELQKPSRHCWRLQKRTLRNRVPPFGALKPKAPSLATSSIHSYNIGVENKLMRLVTSEASFWNCFKGPKWSLRGPNTEKVIFSPLVTLYRRNLFHFALSICRFPRVWKFEYDFNQIFHPSFSPNSEKKASFFPDRFRFSPLTSANEYFVYFFFFNLTVYWESLTEFCVFFHHQQTVIYLPRFPSCHLGLFSMIGIWKGQRASWR